MAALVLTLTGSVVLSGLVLVLFGARFKLAKDSSQNDILNFFVYLGIAAVVLFPLVVFGLANLVSV